MLELLWFAHDWSATGDHTLQALLVGWIPDDSVWSTNYDLSRKHTGIDKDNDSSENLHLWVQTLEHLEESGIHLLVSTSVTTMGLENCIRKPQGYSPVPLLILTVLSRTEKEGKVEFSAGKYICIHLCSSVYSIASTWCLNHFFKQAQ